MQIRAARIGSSPREALSEGWSIRAAEPGEFASPEVLPADGWRQIAALGTVAACERDGGRWSLDHPPARGFDAQDWWYRLQFDLAAPVNDAGAAPLRLCFDGLATLAEVWLNGRSILTSDNMFVAHACTLAPEQLRESGNELTMVFRSLDHELARRRPRPAWRVPMLEQQQLRWIRTTLLGRTPGWSPPAAAVGPWREVRLERAVGVRLETKHLQARLDAADGVLDVTLAFDGSLPPDAVSVELFASGEDSPVARTELALDAAQRWGGQLRVTKPALWWPHTHGAPALYRVLATIRLGDGAEASIDLDSIGFRSIELDTKGDAFTLRINGEPVFCRGACWTPSDPVGLGNDPDALRRLLEQVRDAGMNMLRIGGTMVYEDDVFFDACDALGIMVWQEFMFANMDYPAADAAFLASVERELRQQMQRWGTRASLAVLCGNSEVSQQAAMWGAQRTAWSPALFHEIVPALVEQCLPGVPYWPSSAWGGAFPHQVDAGTTSYYGVGAYLRPQADARRSGLRFATECLGFSNVPAPHTIDRMPGGSALRVTHAAWKARASRDLTAGWDFEDVRDHYLGQLFGVDATRLRYADHERYLTLSRATTGEVMTAAFSEWRRRGSPCGGAFVWFLRDLWAGAGWGVLDDAGLPKPCWHALKRVLQPVALLLTDEGNNGLVAHVVNERAQPLSAVLTLDAWRGDVSLAHAEAVIDVAPRSTLERNVASMLDHFMDLSDAFRFGRRAHDVVVLTLTSATGERLGQAFHFPGSMGLPLDSELGLAAQARPNDDGSVEVRVSSRRFALGVHFETPGFVPSDEFFHLPPRQEACVVFRPLPGARGWRGVVGALNAAQPTAIASAG
jgi:beta-mannosidase